jgi:hypothetical protein
VADCVPSATSRLARNVAVAQAVLRRHIGNQAATGVGGFIVEPHLRAHDHVAVEQAAYAHQHDGAVRRDIAQLVGRAFFGRHHPAAAFGRLALLQFDLPAALHQRLADAARGHFGRFGKRGFGAVAESLEALLADVFLELVQIHQDFGCVARNAQRGGNHQESQDQQEPPGAVDGVEAEQAEHLRPERPELVHVIDQRLGLLEHRADDGGDADDRQQRDRKPHGRQQFHRRPQTAGAPIDLHTLGGNCHA